MLCGSLSRQMLHLLLCHDGVGVCAGLVVDKGRIDRRILLGLNLGQLGLDTLTDLPFNIFGASCARLWGTRAKFAPITCISFFP